VEAPSQAQTQATQTCVPTDPHFHYSALVTVYSKNVPMEAFFPACPPKFLALNLTELPVIPVNGDKSSAARFGLTMLDLRLSATVFHYA
jgi:hypothetical protein